VRACLMFAVQVDGAEVTTIEGLADPAHPSRSEGDARFARAPVRFLHRRIVVGLTGLLQNVPNPTEEEVLDTLAATSVDAPVTSTSARPPWQRSPATRPRRSDGRPGSSEVRRRRREAPRGRSPAERAGVTWPTSSCRGCSTSVSSDRRWLMPGSKESTHRRPSPSRGLSRSSLSTTSVRRSTPAEHRLVPGLEAALHTALADGK